MYITIDVSDNPSDEELKERGRKTSMNGEYINEIFKKCGAFSTNQKTYTKNAKIIEKCSLCFDK